MTAQLIDGIAMARQVRAELAERAGQLKHQHGRPPGLAVVLVGDNPASQTYVRSKRKACEEAGFHSVEYRYPEDTAPGEVLERIARLNAEAAIDGILVQLPLPKQFNVPVVLRAISPDKDVDGFHPENVGRLVLGQKTFVPCTPLGVSVMLERSGVETRGKLAVILGRSQIVGMPMMHLLLRKAPGGDATICVCHSRSNQLPEMCRQADLLIAAMGQPEFVKADMVKPGAVVIDVGINRISDATTAKGYRLVGDVDFEAVRQVAGAITPVPGGVGPMTIAMLLKNTLDAAVDHLAR